MSGNPHDTPRCIYTIGHSNHALDTFIDLLRGQAIEVLVDVRSQPYSRYATHFARHNLEAAVAAAGIRYLYLGRELGGRPAGREFYDAGGHVLYAEVAKSPPFLSGIVRLETGIQTYRVAIMCGEEDPAACHRRLLVGRVLEQRGSTVMHIRGDGRIQSEEQLRAEEAQRSHGDQLALFSEAEVQEWKSIRSVSRNDQRRTSLEP